MSTTPTTYIAQANPTTVFIGTCENCPRPVRTSSEIFMGDHYPFFCPDCKKPVRLARLYGTLTKMDCHSGCQSAYGPKCICSCGGVNHGDIWSQPGEMLVDALKIFLADRKRRQEAAAKAKKTRDDKKAKRQLEAFAAWVLSNISLVQELTATNWRTDPYPNEFLADMADMVERNEPLTDPQTERTAQILARRREVRERIAAENAERDARAASMTEVPSVRQIITGPIVKSWHANSEHGPYIGIKINCNTYEVRGTLPQNLKAEALPSVYSGDDYRNLPRTLIGRTVTLTATLKPDGQKRGQGYFRQPRKAKFVN